MTQSLDAINHLKKTKESILYNPYSEVLSEYMNMSKIVYYGQDCQTEEYRQLIRNAKRNAEKHLRELNRQEMKRPLLELSIEHRQRVERMNELKRIFGRDT